MVVTTEYLLRKWNDFLTSLTLLRSSSFSALSFSRSSPCVLLSVELSSFSVLACLVKEPRLLLCLCNSSVVFFSSLICLSSSCFSHLQHTTKTYYDSNRKIMLPSWWKTDHNLLTTTKTLLNVIRHWTWIFLEPQINSTQSFCQDFSEGTSSGKMTRSVFREWPFFVQMTRKSCFISVQFNVQLI